MLNFNIFSKRSASYYGKAKVNREIWDMVNIHRGREILA